MSRILLVDDSPHAQRMGERILTEEGYEVVTVSNADSALIRLEDVDPDLVLADTVMPGRTGYEICQYLKMSPRHRHVRVILTAGVLEPFDDEQVKRVEADGALKKPFEASALLAAVKPLAEAAAAAPGSGRPAAGTAGRWIRRRPAAAAPFVAVVDAEQVRAAVTVALDAGHGRDCGADLPPRAAGPSDQEAGARNGPSKGPARRRAPPLPPAEGLRRSSLPRPRRWPKRSAA